jgi:hypothetical protein
MSNYRVLQMTNTNIGAVAVNELMPFGIITRRINRNVCTDTDTFSISTTGANLITVNECGNYDVVYSVSAVASAAGIITMNLLVNGVNTYAVSETAAVGDTINLTLPYQIRVLPNSCSTPNNNPVNIQIELTGVAITGGTSNIIVKRVY